MHKLYHLAISIVFALALLATSTVSYAAVDQYGTLKKGDKSPGAYELQRALDELGFFEGTYSNLYGDQTAAALKAFQKSLGMSTDGVAGKQTLILIRDHQLFLRNMNLLRPGVEGERVEQLKSDLKVLGFYNGSMGAKYDDALKKAVMSFQKSKNIKPDEKVGDVTLEAVTKSVMAKKGYTAAEKTATAKATTTKAKTTQVTATTTKKIAQTSAPKSNVSTSTKRVTSRGAKAVSLAKELIGISYRYGGSSKNGYDCSGFTMYVMAKLGVDLPHGSMSQATIGTTVKKNALKEGDLLFFKTDSKPIGHVGIYIGGGKFIHASSGKGEVIISNLNTYQAKYIKAKRVL